MSSSLIYFFFLIHAAQAQFTTNSNNTIYYNSGNVGIGMTTPQVKLHVVGGVSSTAYDPQNNLISFTELWPENALIWKGGSGTNFRFGAASDLFATGWQEWMRLTDAGNLLVNKTTQSNTKKE